MKLSQLEKSQKIIARIKELDDEIIKLEKLAQELLDNNNIIDLKISIKRIQKQDYKEKEDQEYQPFQGLYTLPSFMTRISSDEYEHTEYRFIDTQTVQLIGFMLHLRNHERSIMLKDLEKLGVDL